MKNWQKNIPEIAIVVTAMVVFLLKFDVRALDPTNIDWLFRIGFDNTTEFISWEYYRCSPWRFPELGYMVGYDYPTETGVGLTGAIPLLAIPIKALSPWLPTHFQHFGWWYFLCYTLQGFFAVKLLRGIGQNFAARFSNFELWLGAVFFLLAPPFLFRASHMNLNAHFLVLAALAVYFQDITVKKKIYYNAILVGIAAATHQYLTVMIMGLALATTTDLWNRKRLAFWQLAVANAANLALALFIFYISGVFLVPLESVQNSGFGFYSANLNAFFNSLNYTKIQPALKTATDGQYEGYGYLGFGFLFLFIPLIFNQLSRFWQKKVNPLPNERVQLYPVLFMVGLLFFYSLSNVVSFNENVIFKWAMGPLGNQIFSSLRGSGRFIWPAFYLLMATLLTQLAKANWPKMLKISILSVLLAVQAYDVQPLFEMHKVSYEPCDASCGFKKWEPIFAECDRVIMFPPYVWTYKSQNDFYDFAQAAVAHQKPITTGYFARRNWDAVLKYGKQLYADWEKGSIGENGRAVFVGQIHKMTRLKPLVDAGLLQPYVYDGLAVLVPPSLAETIKWMNALPGSRKIAFDTEGVADFLRRNADKTIMVVAREEAASKLGDPAKNLMTSMGAPEIWQMGWAGAYIGIFHQNKTVFSQADNQQILTKNWPKGAVVNGFVFQKDVQLASGGATMGKASELKIDGKDYSPNERGLNFIVLDAQFNVVETAFFDTYDESVRVFLK